MVHAAGVDVSSWSDFRGKNPAVNPNYCFSWSFVEPDKVVVLNLWHEDLQESNGLIIDKWNARNVEQEHGRSPKAIARAKAMDEAIQEAYKKNLPIRAVICKGKKRNHNDSNPKSSSVNYRLLDPEPWHVSHYDFDSGNYTLTRGMNNLPNSYIDQFDLSVPDNSPTQKVPVKGSVYVRRPEVRRFVLSRANGKCEFCGEDGFLMKDGKIYLETHHVNPLYKGGEDAVHNVAALCPNHHREAHHGSRSSEIHQFLLKKLQS